MADREVSWASPTDRDRASTTGPPPIVCTHTHVELVGAESDCWRGQRAAGVAGSVGWTAPQGDDNASVDEGTKKMVVDGTDLQGNDGMWQSAQLTGPFLLRAFTEMPCAPVAWTLILSLCCGWADSSGAATGPLPSTSTATVRSPTSSQLVEEPPLCTNAKESNGWSPSRIPSHPLLIRTGKRERPGAHEWTLTPRHHC